MPLFEYECPSCSEIFEEILSADAKAPKCPHCGAKRTVKRFGAVAVHVKADVATPRIEKRVKDYLKDGRFSEATRFADKATAMTKSEKAKRIADKLHHKTGK
jgi:putative FmdB family regulatory protein